MGLVLFGLLVFPKVFRKHKKNLRENQTYKRKPKKTNNNFRQTKKNKFSKVSDPPLDMGLVLFGVWVFPKVFRRNTTFGKTNKQNKTKPISKGGSETFNNFVF